MKGFKPFPLLGLAIIFYMLLMTACGGKIPQNGPSALNFATSSTLTTGAQGDPYSQTLQATGGVQPYTWSLESGTLPPGFSFSSSGVLSGTPPPGSGSTMGTVYSFTVRVTDSQSPTKAYNTQTFSLTINLPLSFTSSTLANGVIGAPYGGTTIVKVGPAAGGVNCQPPLLSPCYTYTLAPNSAPLPAGLTLNSVGGQIVGTPTGPIGTYPFVVQATDGFPTTATANFSITITAKVQGGYAFSFNGYNQQGNAFFMAGSFVADGGGNITSGVFDRNGNDSTGVKTNVVITPGSGGNGQCPGATGPPSGSGSVYCVGRPGVTDGSNLGTLVIVSSLGTYSFSVSASLTGDSGIILADPSNPGAWGSGVLKPQEGNLTLGSGSFAFGLSGVDGSGNRYGSAGFFITDSSGNISCPSPPCGGADVNDNGTVQTQVALSGSVSSVDPNTGRGTATFTIGSTTLDYALYVVPGKPFPTLVGVQTDPVSSSVPVTLASIAQRQAAAGGGFTNHSLNATRGGSTNGAVFELNALSNSSGTPVADVSLGLGNFDGNGNITAYTFDENNGGTLTTPAQNNYTGTYSVDSANPQSGRVTVNLAGVTNQPVWYLVTFNAGFVIGTDPGVTSGTFEPQVVMQPIFITAMFGNYYGGTSNPVLPSVINEVGAVLANPPPPPGMGTGTYALLFDSSGTAGILMNQMFTGSTCLSESSTCPSVQEGQSPIGRFLINDSSGNPADILYVVSSTASGSMNLGLATKSVTLTAGPSPSLFPIVQ
jgi:Putative Ig domain